MFGNGTVYITRGEGKQCFNLLGLRYIKDVKVHSDVRCKFPGL